MNIPGRAFLEESDPSKSVCVNPGEYLVTAPTVDSDVSSPTQSVGAGEASFTDQTVVLWTTISARNYKGKIQGGTHEIKSIDKREDHFVVTAATATGELLEFEVLPHRIYWGGIS